MKIIIKDKRHLLSAARKLIGYAADRRIFAFYGILGAGKTTFIKSLCRQLSAIDVASSPTFTLVNEYMTCGGELLYHIDLYRIKDISEAFDIGIEEYLHSGNYCFIEWPGLAEEILPEKTLKIRITVGTDEERIIETV